MSAQCLSLYLEPETQLTRTALGGHSSTQGGVMVSASRRQVHSSPAAFRKSSGHFVLFARVEANQSLNNVFK